MFVTKCTFAIPKFYVMKIPTYIYILLFSITINAQVGIGTTNPHVSALLELNSENSGLLIPRMIELQRDDINNPTAGLLIYQTDGNKGFYYFDGSAWLALNEDGDSDALNEIELPQSPNLGDMSYWNGTNWEVIPATVNEGATLQMISGVPTWIGGIDTTTPPEIGEYYEGGIVFYIATTPTDLDGDGVVDTGLICSIEDQGNEQWSDNIYETTNASQVNIGKGYSNTQIIISKQEITINSYAAGIASTYAGGGFTDWFLPSKKELIEMFDKQTIINDGSTANYGDNLVGNYWSSTESNNASSDSRAIAYWSNAMNSVNKTDNYNVRAIRVF